MTRVGWESSFVKIDADPGEAAEMTTEHAPTEYAKSSDGTRIAFESNGSGPLLVLVDGAMCHRRFGPAEPFTEALRDAFTVVTYDRRGRGESGDSSTYRPELELDDLRAVIDTVGGKPYVLGLLVRRRPRLPRGRGRRPDGEADRVRGAVRRAPRRSRLRGRPRPPHRRGQDRQGRRLLHGEDGRRPVLPAGHVPADGQAVAADEADRADAPLRRPRDGRRLRGAGRASSRRSRSRPWSSWGSKAKPEMSKANAAIAAAIPGAEHSILEGQTHNVTPAALRPEIVRFFA